MPGSSPDVTGDAVDVPCGVGDTVELVVGCPDLVKGLVESSGVATKAVVDSA